jgi:hypothetical protein
MRLLGARFSRMVQLRGNDICLILLDNREA